MPDPAGQTWTLYVCDICGKDHHEQYAGLRCKTPYRACNGYVQAIEVVEARSTSTPLEGG